MGCMSYETEKSMMVVEGSAYTKEVARFDINLAKVHDCVEAYVVEHCPVDILLGVPFLEKHSPGFRQMMNEFLEARLPQETGRVSIACLILWHDRLEHVLDKYPNLILDKNQLPPQEGYTIVTTEDFRT